MSPGIALIQAKARQTYREAQTRIQASLGGLDRISPALASARGRKSLFFFSEGFIPDTTLPGFRTLVQTARNANVAVHFVDVRSPEGLPGQPGLAGGGADTARAVEDAMRRRHWRWRPAMRTDTGDRHRHRRQHDYRDEPRLRPDPYCRPGPFVHLLGYSSTNTRRDGAFRKIEVGVTRSGVEVRARGGTTPLPTQRRAPGDKLDPAVRAGLDSPLGVSGIPLRLASYTFGAGSDGKVQTLLVAEADPAPLQLRPRDGRYTGVLKWTVLVGHRKTGECSATNGSSSSTCPRTRSNRHGGRPADQAEIPIGAGPLFRDNSAAGSRQWLIGSIRHEFDVPRPDSWESRRQS